LAKKGQKIQSFSLEFKLKAVKMYQSGMSMRETAQKLGLSDHSYVRRWVKAYKNNGQTGLENHRTGQIGRINLGIANSKNPELKIKWLEAEVALLKKIAAWERGCARRSSCFPLSEN
jgi:transposase-like protein